MKILNERKLNYDNFDNGLSSIVCKCGCHFSANESDIEVEVINVLYDKGIRKKLKIAKKHIYSKYITCPVCFRKMKVKYCVEDSKNE